MQDQWRRIIQEAIAEDHLLYKELTIRLEEAVEFIQDKDPAWFQAHSANQPTSSNKIKTELKENLVS